MKKSAHTTPCLLVTLTLSLCLNGAARHGVQTAKAQATGASAGMALDRLERGLKESVALDFRQRYARRTFVRLKRRGGCGISFRLSQIPGSSYVNDPGKAGPDISIAEWSLNLSELDPDRVTLESPAKGDYRVLRFSTLGGKESIKWRGSGAGDGGWAAEGRLDIGEKVAPRIAAALKQAISACRE